VIQPWRLRLAGGPDHFAAGGGKWRLGWALESLASLGQPLIGQPLAVAALASALAVKSWISAVRGVLAASGWPQGWG